MPIEIKELLIQAQLRKPEQSVAEDRPGEAPPAGLLAHTKEEIVATCLAELKEWLREQKMR